MWGVTITFFLEEILLTFCYSLLLCSDSFVIGLPGPVSEVWTWNIVSWELMLDLICWWQTFTQQNQVMSVLSFLMPCAMQQRYHRNLVLHLINRQWLHFSLNNNSYEVYSSNSNPMPLSFWWQFIPAPVILVLGEGALGQHFILFAESPVNTN